MKSTLPILDWLRNYNRGDLKHDIPAGLTVGIMLIPQGMAYALIAGLPAEYGLYAAIAPQLVYALLGTSWQLAVGPVALDSLIVASGLSMMEFTEPSSYIFMAIALAFLVGAIQFVMGLLRLGFVVNFLSRPVISGFTSGAAIIIGMNQVKHILGIEIPRTNELSDLLIQLVKHAHEVNWFAFLVGGAGILIYLMLKRYFKYVPAALVLVVLGILLVWSLNLKTINIVGEIPAGLPDFRWINFNNMPFNSLFQLAITLALVGFMEAISLAKILQEKSNDHEVNANQELIALGAGNMVGSLFQAYPTTGGFSRSMVNHSSGAKTPLTLLVSAAVVAATLIWLTPMFYFLPKAILGAIIIVAVVGLVDFKFPLSLWKYKRADLAMLLLTFGLTLFVGIMEGICGGMLLSLGLMIYRSAKPHIAVLERVKGTPFYKNVDRFNDTVSREDLVVVRFDAQLYFANLSYFQSTLRSIIKDKGEKLKLIVLNAEAINFVDSSALVMLNGFYGELRRQGIDLFICGAIGPVRDVMHKSGFTERVGSEAFFVDVNDAVRFYEGQPVVKAYQQLSSQVNS